jgi:hypothetical protein
MCARDARFGILKKMRLADIGIGLFMARTKKPRPA